MFHHFAVHGSIRRAARISAGAVRIGASFAPDVRITSLMVPEFVMGRMGCRHTLMEFGLVYRSQRTAAAAARISAVRPDGLRVDGRLGTSVAGIISNGIGWSGQNADDNIPFLGFENTLEASVATDAFEIFMDDGFSQHGAQCRFRSDNLLPFLTVFNGQN
jgi:hypothetical protein